MLTNIWNVNYIKWHSLLILYFCRVIRIFGFNKTDSPGYDTTGRLTRRGMIPGPGEIDSAGYDALGSNVMADLLLTRRVMSLWYSRRLTSRGIIPSGDGLAEVENLVEPDSPGYHTQWRLTCRGIIPSGDWLAGVSYPWEIEKFDKFNQNRNILTHWPVVW